MGSRPPPSASSSASLLLPSLSPASDPWFISSSSDLLLTQALTRQLHSTSASSSSSGSAPSVEASLASKVSPQSKHSFQLQTHSNVSQVGSPLSSDSVSKDQSESPFNYSNSGNLYGMNSIPMSNCDTINESCVTQQYHASQGGHKKAATQAVSVALSSRASAGAGASKVSKRRSRASKKMPITVLSADTSNFRAMVQQLTGIPTPPSIWGSPSGVPLLKPQPTRVSPLDMPTLDTSSSFLAPKMNPFLQQARHEVFAALMAAQKGKPILGNSYHPNKMNYDALLSSAAPPASPWDLLASAKCSDGSFAKGSPKQPSTADMGAARPSPTSIESFLMVDEDQYLKVPFNTVDSWLSFDGGAMSNPSPRLDLAEIAS